MWEVESVGLGSNNRRRRNDLPVSALGWAPTALDTQEGFGGFAMMVPYREIGN